MIDTSEPQHGSIAHEYWKRFYAQRFREHGYKVEFEVPRKSGQVDVVAKKENEKIAIEIETGKSDIDRNILKLKKSRITSCYMIATDKAVEIKIKKLTKEYSFIRVFFVKDFFKLTKDMLTSSSS